MKQNLTLEALRDLLERRDVHALRAALAEEHPPIWRSCWRRWQARRSWQFFAPCPRRRRRRCSPSFRRRIRRP